MLVWYSMVVNFHVRIIVYQVHNHITIDITTLISFSIRLSVRYSLTMQIASNYTICPLYHDYIRGKTASIRNIQDAPIIEWKLSTYGQEFVIIEYLKKLKIKGTYFKDKFNKTKKIIIFYLDILYIWIRENLLLFKLWDKSIFDELSKQLNTFKFFRNILC